MLLRVGTHIIYIYIYLSIYISIYRTSVTYRKSKWKQYRGCLRQPLKSTAHTIQYMQYSTLQYVRHCTHGKLHEVHMHISYVSTSVIVSVTAEAEQVDAHTQGTVSRATHTHTPEGITEIICYAYLRVLFSSIHKSDNLFITCCLSVMMIHSCKHTHIHTYTLHTAVNKNTQTSHSRRPLMLPFPVRLVVISTLQYVWHSTHH